MYQHPHTLHHSYIAQKCLFSSVCDPCDMIGFVLMSASFKEVQQFEREMVPTCP